MTSDDTRYTYNPLSNEDKDLLLRNGYVPGELEPEEQREILEDLRVNEDEDGGSLRSEIPADERDDS